MESLRIGLRGHAEFTVRAEDSAKAFRSGSLDVPATPVLIAAAEETCADLVQPLLADGMGTVGTQVSIRHLAPSPIGMKYWCDAEVTAVGDRVICFGIVLYDEKDKIGEGTHERVIINEERFFSKAQKKLMRE